MDRDNRKSHLAPQLSPATQDLLRSSDSPTSYGAQQTPTACKNHHYLLEPVRMLTSRSVSCRPSAASIGSIPAGRSGRSSVHPGMGSLSSDPGINSEQLSGSPNRGRASLASLSSAGRRSSKMPRRRSSQKAVALKELHDTESLPSLTSPNIPTNIQHSAASARWSLGNPFLVFCWCTLNRKKTGHIQPGEEHGSSSGWSR